MKPAKHTSIVPPTGAPTAQGPIHGAPAHKTNRPPLVKGGCSRSTDDVQTSAVVVLAAFLGSVVLLGYQLAHALVVIF